MAFVGQAPVQQLVSVAGGPERLCLPMKQVSSEPENSNPAPTMVTMVMMSITMVKRL